MLPSPEPLQRTVRGIGSDPMCPRCYGGIEDVEHLFRSCSHSSFMWRKMASFLIKPSTAQQQVEDWFYENLKSSVLVAGTLPNYLLFSCSLWMLWKWRCSSIFDSKFSPPPSSHLVVYQFAESWLSANSGGVMYNSKWMSVSWEPPGKGWDKLNTDGSYNCENGKMAAGGVLRDYRRAWLAGIVVNKGVGSVLEAEIWGMIEGLTMAWKIGIRRLIVESDSLESVQLINKDISVNHPLFSLIQNCKNLVEADWCCLVKHVHREGNKLADGLAHMGQSMKESFMFFDSPPQEVARVYDDDCRGVASVRHLAASVSKLF